MKAIWKFGARKKKGERGIMMAVAAMGFTTFLLAAGLAVDISNFYTAGTELQNAADAAAMAGANMLDKTPAGIQKAVDQATRVANNFNFNLSQVTIPANNVRFAVNLSQFDNGGSGLTQAQAAAAPANIRFVRVNVAPTNVKVYLAGMVLGNQQTFHRAAVAGQSPGPQVGNEPGASSIANPARLTLVEDWSGSNTLSVVGSCSNNTRYTKGCTYTVNMTPPCDALAATYEVAEGSYTSGTSNWSQRIMGGLNGCFCMDATLPVWTHPQAVNVRRALSTVFNVYSSDIPTSMASTFPPDSNIRQGITYQQYKNGTHVTAPTASSTGVNGGVSGRRILILGIMKNTSWWIDPNDPTYEIATMRNYKYGAFFLKSRPSTSGQLSLEYIEDKVLPPYSICNKNCPAIPPGADLSPGIASPVLYR